MGNQRAGAHAVMRALVSERVSRWRIESMTGSGFQPGKPRLAHNRNLAATSSKVMGFLGWPFPNSTVWRTRRPFRLSIVTIPGIGKCPRPVQIGRAWCGERVGQFVFVSVVVI